MDIFALEAQFTNGNIRRVWGPYAYVSASIADYINIPELDKLQIINGRNGEVVIEIEPSATIH